MTSKRTANALDKKVVHFLTSKCVNFLHILSKMVVTEWCFWASFRLNLMEFSKFHEIYVQDPL